jgi:hypothetical protein
MSVACRRLTGCLAAVLVSSLVGCGSASSTGGEPKPDGKSGELQVTPVGGGVKGNQPGGHAFPPGKIE